MAENYDIVPVSLSAQTWNPVREILESSGSREEKIRRLIDLAARRYDEFRTRQRSPISNKQLGFGTYSQALQALRDLGAIDALRELQGQIARPQQYGLRSFLRKLGRDKRTFVLASIWRKTRPRRLIRKSKVWMKGGGKDPVYALMHRKLSRVSPTLSRELKGAARQSAASRRKLILGAGIAPPVASTAIGTGVTLSQNAMNKQPLQYAGLLSASGKLAWKGLKHKIPIGATLGGYGAYRVHKGNKQRAQRMYALKPWQKTAWEGWKGENPELKGSFPEYLVEEHLDGVPPEILDDLAESKNLSVRRRVAEAAEAWPSTLNKLWATGDFHTQNNMLKRKAPLPRDIIQKAIAGTDIKDPYVARSIARRTDLPPEFRSALFTHHNPAVVAAALHRDDVTREELKRALESPIATVHSAAKHRIERLDEEHRKIQKALWLKRCSKRRQGSHGAMQRMYALKPWQKTAWEGWKGENPELKGSFPEYLVEEHLDGVPPEILDDLAESKNLSVRRRVAEAAEAWPSTLNKLWATGDFHTQNNMLKRKAPLPRDIIQKAIAGTDIKDPYVARSIARRTDLPPEFRSALFTHHNPAVVAAALHRDDVTREELKRALESPIATVHSAAKHRIERLDEEREYRLLGSIYRYAELGPALHPADKRPIKSIPAPAPMPLEKRPTKGIGARAQSAWKKTARKARSAMTPRQKSLVRTPKPGFRVKAPRAGLKQITKGMWKIPATAIGVGTVSWLLNELLEGSPADVRIDVERPYQSLTNVMRYAKHNPAYAYSIRERIKKKIGKTGRAGYALTLTFLLGYLTGLIGKEKAKLSRDATNINVGGPAQYGILKGGLSGAGKAWNAVAGQAGNIGNVLLAGWMASELLPNKKKSSQKRRATMTKLAAPPMTASSGGNQSRQTRWAGQMYSRAPKKAMSDYIKWLRQARREAKGARRHLAKRKAQKAAAIGLGTSAGAVGGYTVEDLTGYALAPAQRNELREILRDTLPAIIASITAGGGGYLLGRHQQREKTRQRLNFNLPKKPLQYGGASWRAMKRQLQQEGGKGIRGTLRRWLPTGGYQKVMRQPGKLTGRLNKTVAQAEAAGKTIPPGVKAQATKWTSAAQNLSPTDLYPKFDAGLTKEQVMERVAQLKGKAATSRQLAARTRRRTIPLTAVGTGVGAAGGYGAAELRN